MEEVLTNDPPKGATKVNGTAKATDSSAQTQPTSEGPKGATLVKKKDDTSSTVGNVSQKPVAQVTEPSAPSGASKQVSGKTQLSQQEEVQFQDWYKKVSSHKGLDGDADSPDQFYDYRGFWKNEKNGRNNILTDDPEAHFIDKYKTPGHPTFSNESIYSNDKTPGGRWEEKDGKWTFHHSKYTQSYADRTNKYLEGTGESAVIDKPSAKSTYEQRVSNLLSTTQNQFNEEVNKKKAEFQAIVDKDPSQEKSVNEQFQSFISQKETEYNAQLDKWMSMYQKDFQQKDFEANKETDPLKTAYKTAWTTLAYDLPSQLYATRAATSSGIQKLLDETVGKVTPIEKEKAGKIEQAWEGVLKNVFGVEDEKIGERTAGDNKGKEVIIADVMKSIELSKISAENKKYLVNSLDKVKDGDFVDWMNYAGAAIGQGVGQIPASVATFGASSIGQQVGSIYMDSLQKIAEDEGITIEEVIRQGKDDVVYPILFGVGTGLLDYIGAKNIGGAISKDFIMGSLRKRAIHTIAAGGIESATETAQTSLEDIGVNKARGKSWRETISQFDASKLPDAALQGLIAGTFLSGAGQSIKVATDKMSGDRIKVKKSPMETIKKAIDEVDVNDIKSVDAVAKEITESIQNPAEEIKPKTQVYDESKTTEETGSVVSSEKPAEDSSVDSTVENATVTTEGEQQDVRQPEYNEQTEQETLRQQILNSPEDLRWDGNKVTILTEKGSQMLQEYDRIRSEGKTTSQPDTQSREGLAAEAPTIIPDEQISEKGRQEEVLSPPAQQEVTEEINQQELSPPPAVAQTKVGQRMAASEEPSQIKEKVSEGDKYIPKQIIKTDQEAKKILDDWDDTEFAERVIRDRTNGMPGETRGAIGAHLYEQYKKEAESAKNPEEKQRAYDKAADIAVWVAQNLTKAGQETAIAGKIWKSLLGSEDLLVAAMEKQVGQQRTKKLEPLREEVTQTKEQIEAEIRKRVTEGVEAQLPKAKLITTEQRKKISDAFDALKIKDVEGTANDVIRVLGAAVWNGSLDVMKRATLAGADIANAIQQGIDYVRENYKGTDFDEAEFRSIVTPVLEQSSKPVKRRRVKSSEISEDVVKTPKLSRKQKRNVIDKTVDAFNEEKLTDEKFDEIYSTELGIKSFSPEERTEIRDLAKIISEAEKFSESVKDNFTKENLDKHKALFKKAQLANQKLNRMSREQSDVWKTLATILQLNLLSSISFVRNMYTNTILQPMRFASTALAMIPDRIVSGLAKLELIGESYKDHTIDLVALQKGYFQGGWNGIIEGLYQMKHGQLASERELREISGKFDPVAALQRLKAGDQTTKQKINDYIESTLGWPAEISARLLNLGDKPFRRAAELARGFEIGTLKGLKGVELAKFVAFPDEISMQDMTKAGLDATFQNDTKASTVAQNFMNKLMEVLPGPLKLIAKTQMPFIKTPANILVETFSYALPPVTFVLGVHQISQGNKRAGSMLIGKSLVGAMIWQASYMLLEAGLMTAGDDDKEGKSAERKSIMYDTAPPNSLNTSALIRMLAGEKSDIKDDDVWVNFKDMGIMGLLMDTFSNSYYKSVKDGKDPSDNIGDLFGTGALNILSGSLQQSFLQGTNTLLEAMKDPEGYAGQKWVVNTTDALSSVIVPRAISAISPASDEYIRDTRDNKTGEALINSFKNKFFMGDTMPARVNLWGEKITGNPEGRNRAVYYLFDPTKFKEVSTDDFKWKIYKQWRDSGFDDDWLPGMPDRSVSVRGVKIPLTSEEYSRYATAVGQNRKSLASGYMMIAPKPDKKMLKMYYDYGRQAGAAQFLLSTGWQVKTKEELQKIADSRK